MNNLALRTERTLTVERATPRERTITPERAIVPKRTIVEERAMGAKRTSTHERAIDAKRTTPTERTWFDRWQAKRIAAKSNRKQFRTLKSLSDLSHD